MQKSEKLVVHGVAINVTHMHTKPPKAAFREKWASQSCAQRKTFHVIERCSLRRPFNPLPQCQSLKWQNIIFEAALRNSAVKLSLSHLVSKSFFFISNFPRLCFLVLLCHECLPRRRLGTVCGRRFPKERGKNTFVGRPHQKACTANHRNNFLSALIQKCSS